MSNEQTLEELIVKVDDFRSSGYLEIIKNSVEHGYISYSESLLKAASRFIEVGNTTQGKVLKLLANATSMMLKPESRNEPFGPMWIMDGKRSALPDDFSQQDLSFFEEILPEIQDYRLKARIADILWLVKKPRKVEHGLCAIDSYMQFPLDLDSYTEDANKAWHRAITLVLILNNGAGEKIQNIRDSLFLQFQTANYSKKLPMRLSQLLGLVSLPKDQAEEVAKRLEFFAQTSKKYPDIFCTRTYFKESLKWGQNFSDLSEVYRLTMEIAETYVTEAVQRSSENNLGDMLAGHCYEKAIQTYRGIPKKERARYKVDERIKELHKKMNSANKSVLDRMAVIEAPPIDISQVIEAIRNHVAGKSYPDVLVAFGNIHSGAKIDQFFENAKKNMDESPIRKLFSTTHMARDGRIAAQTPGCISNDLERPENQLAIWADMVMEYRHEMDFAVKGIILPALQVIIAEHRVTEKMIFSLCQYSSIIPLGREALWAKGLYFGFEYDFVISTHLLIPQLEHLVRTIMKQNGIKTTTLDAKGIETENGLSTLLENKESEKLLGENLVFELKALLAEPIGPNLRNEIAHGLVGPEIAVSGPAIYLWWLCLRYVINSIAWQKPEMQTALKENVQ